MVKSKARGKSIRTILSYILLTTGLLFILVPAIKTYSNTKQNDYIIEQFLQNSEQALIDIELMEDEDLEPINVPTLLPAPNTNSNIKPQIETTESIISPTPEKKSKMSKEEIQKRMIGVLIISKINVKMVIMDGVDDDTLRVAAGRLPDTGNFDEIGNCVLAGHRSYTFGKYLHRLNELKEGDKITVQTKEKTLNYTVYKSLIIEPDDFSIIESNDTEKILTVFTCHPPGIGSHRLVVHAKQDE